MIFIESDNYFMVVGMIREDGTTFHRNLKRGKIGKSETERIGICLARQLVDESMTMMKLESKGLIEWQSRLSKMVIEVDSNGVNR